LTGLLGDLPAPASCALGGFISSLPTGGSLQLVVERRGQFSAGAALVAALPIVAQALSDGTLDWGNVARTALAAAAVAVLLALVKYARAFGDPPVAGTGTRRLWWLASRGRAI